MVEQVEPKNLASNELINFHHKKDNETCISGTNPWSEWFGFLLWSAHVWSVISSFFFKLKFDPNSLDNLADPAKINNCYIK